MRRRALAFVGCASIACGACSWGVFDDYKKDTPSYAFTNQVVAGVVAISPNRADKTAFLATAGPGQGARFYALGDGTADPSGDAISGIHCVRTQDRITTADACMSATTIAGVGTLLDGAGNTHVGCFAIGYGREPLATHDGPVVACTDDALFVLGAPTDAPALASIASGTSTGVSIAALPSDGTSNPPLVLGDPADAVAYFYGRIEEALSPTRLGAPNGEVDFGASVALGEGVVAVGAPSAGKVYSFDFKGTPTGCIDAGAGGGDALTIGAIDGVSTLVVRRGDGTVGTYPVASLSQNCAAPPSAVFACVETNGASGCASARFGSSSAIGDLDGDGATELVIGAPGASIDGDAAGVVFLFTPSRGTAVEDVRALGHPSGGESFGASVAIGPVGGLDTLVVAAPGAGAAYAEWCPSLPATPSGARCRR